LANALTIQANSAAVPADPVPQAISGILDNYRVATDVCLRAGFDGVEPHGAHGYVLNQFFSPVQNLRTDGYGGDLKGRMRMAVEVVRAVKSAAGDDLLLLYRHTPVGQGYGIEESLILGQALVAEGVDVLDLSPSSFDAPGDRAAPFRALGVPVIAVNELDTVERALDALNQGRADLIAVGRGMIADPEWATKVMEQRYDEIVQCIRCDGCHADLRRGAAVGCTQWVTSED
jgi:NADPH2 dehydrogenase